MEITPEMEIVRERVLSLIPKKEDGKFAHGALKEFANSIGLKSGNLISDWINSRSHSYMNYLYEIAAKYNVSVEWLKGETDIKNPASEAGDGSEEELIQLFRLLPDDLKAGMLAQIKAVLAQRGLLPGKQEPLAHGPGTD